MTKGKSNSGDRRGTPNVELLTKELKTRWVVERAGRRSAKTLQQIAKELLVPINRVVRAWQAVRNLQQWDDTVVQQLRWNGGRPFKGVALSQE